MRFHILALSHTKVLREYSACAFTNKVRLLCKMLHDRGHAVYLYAPEGSEAVCTEMVPVLDAPTFRKVHGAYDWRITGFDIGRDNVAYEAFRRNTRAALMRRAEPGDVVCATFGMNHQPIIADLPDWCGLIPVESGIGYYETFAQHRVFESYTWQALIYGKEGKHNTPSLYDAVIANAYDLDDYPSPYPFKDADKPAGDYFLFVARPNQDKGLSIAVDAARAVGLPLYAAGQGTPEQWAGTEHLGVLSVKDRAFWMAGARAVFCPSLYVEPWCNVAVEAQLMGTPVITTDFGAFAENVLHGVTGYRCHTMPEFIEAARAVDRLDRAACRRWAEQYSLEHIGARYEAYFTRLAGIYGGEAGDFYGHVAAPKEPVSA